MRRIERTGRFKRDYQRELRGPHGKLLEKTLRSVLEALTMGDTLDARYRDHPLTGEWAGFRDCHIRPDLVLIYEKPDDQVLRLMRLGSRSELGW
ncbi:MAG TPA: type II toxin-antitoxin system YafQ family toxin [Caulobacteraceae bacterium]|nr:type II toxin-antitoxin system YafQ family toxin [Caulobacteraceae bacterium]